jgi:hypothetical protein
MFTLPTLGTSVEVGRSITDANSHFDMYIDPAAQ